MGAKQRISLKTRLLIAGVIKDAAEMPDLENCGFDDLAKHINAVLHIDGESKITNGTAWKIADEIDLGDYFRMGKRRNHPTQVEAFEFDKRMSELESKSEMALEVFYNRLEMCDQRITKLTRETDMAVNELARCIVTILAKLKLPRSEIITALAATRK